MPRLRVNNIGQLLERLGGISPHRIRLHPAPGTATQQDVIDILTHSNRIYELVDGVLVEKIMEYPESSLAVWIAYLLQVFLEQHDLGNLAGSDGTMRIMPNLVRIPDISFVRWEKLPSREPPGEPIPDLVPDLAVEVLSEGNTPREMRRKVREYLLAGVEIIWLVDMRTRTVEVHAAPDKCAKLTEEDTLDGGTVLPGLSLPVKQLFSRVPRSTTTRPEKTPTEKKRRKK